MTWWIWCIVAAVLVLAFAGIRSWALAVRIDRLHRRVVQTRLSLARTLVKRASDCLQLADSGLLDPPHDQLLDRAARSSLAALEVPIVDDGLGRLQAAEEAAKFPGAKTTPDTVGDEQRYVVESELSAVLRDALTPDVRERLANDQLGAVLLEEVEASSYRLRVVRSLHNQDVSQVRTLREKFQVRALHLAGHAALPGFVDLDDAI